MRRLTVLLLLLMMLSGCGVPSGGAPRGLGRVAYIQGTDLWVRPLPSGKPKQLTRNGGYSSPRWSASGTWLTVRRGQAWWAVRTTDGAQVSLPGIQAAQWAPKEDLLAYIDDLGRIGLIDIGSRTRRVLVRQGVGEVFGGPAWSPDGAWLAYVVQRNRSGQPGRAALSKVPTGPGGGAPQEVYAVRSDVPAPACLYLAGWTPDSQSLLYWPNVPCSGSLLADGTALVAVAASGRGQPRELVPSMLIHPDFLAPSPATGLLAVVAGPGRITWSTKQVQVVDPRTGKTTPISPRDVAAVSPAWAPHGGELAFVAAPDTGPGVGGGEPARLALSQRRIWVAQPDGTRTKPLTQDPRYRDEAPVYAGDGGRILFARLDRENRASLWVTRFEEVDYVTDLDAPPEAWMGYYGWLDWSAVFAYRR